jgi:hypothetical protein
MHLVGLATKLAVIVAAGGGLYLASHYSNGRSVSNWSTSAVSSESKEPLTTEPARASSSSQQRLRAEPGSCASQTWPNISPECMDGQAEPTKVGERPALVPEQPSSTLLRPTRLPEAVPDPEVTGSLPASDLTTIGERERPVVAKAKTRRERAVNATAKTPVAERLEAGRRNRSSPMIAVVDRAAPEPAERVREPIQYRLAEGNR